MTTVTIPAWNALGILPTVNSDLPASPDRSPHAVSLNDLVMRFATTVQRQAVFKGLLDYRAELPAWVLHKAETLAIGDVCACHFKVYVSDTCLRTTLIKPLHVDGAGIAAAAFNDGLTSLTTQTLALNALREPADETSATFV